MDSRARKLLLIGLITLLVSAGVAHAQETPKPSQTFQIPNFTSRENISGAVQAMILLSVLSLAPAIVLMVTSFTRIIIVLTLLRQALGAQQLPPNQVLVGLSMFMTFLVMAPTWQRVNQQALQPYMNNQLDGPAAFTRGMQPIREFMSQQIDRAHNDADVDVFTDAAKLPRAKNWEDVPTTALIPAFMLSELKVAFSLGFKIFLPFVVIDLVVSMLLVSGGMMMMPPTLVSLPFKLLMFVLVDGWRLITGSLIASFVGS